MSGMTKWGRTSVAGLCLGLVIGCTPIIRDHGYVPIEEDLAAIAVGKDTRESVLQKIGAPSTGGALNDTGHYYVKSRVRTIGPARPEVIERQVVAISFDGRGRVANIERFGLEDGNAVALSRRVTSSSTENKGFIRQLLGNLGRFSPGQFLGG